MLSYLPAIPFSKHKHAIVYVQPTNRQPTGKVIQLRIADNANEVSKLKITYTSKWQNI